LKTGLSVILCCGEQLEEREAGRTAEVVEAQLQAVVDVIGKDAAKWKSVISRFPPHSIITLTPTPVPFLS
jgi:triosephosphate isomerase